MKPATLAFVGMLLLSSSTFAGTVSFLNPSTPSSGDPSILELTPGSTGTFDVWVTESAINPAGAVGMVIATFSDLTFTDWIYSDEFTAVTFTRSTHVTDQIFDASEIVVGGADLFGAIGFPIMIGTLTIAAPEGMALGDFTIFVDHDLDGVSKVGAGSQSDPLFGMGTIRVTPEPATLVLLGLGGMAILRRR